VAAVLVGTAARQNLAVRVELFAGDHLLGSAVSETIRLA
jgi:hypothetical protein